MTVRQEKVASAIRQIVAREMLALRDPRLKLITITEVKVSGDLSHARIFWLPYDDAEAKDAGAALAAAAGHFRTLIGREMRLRAVPEVQFLYDETERKANRVEALLDGLKK